MKFNLLIAIIVVYLVIAVLFESFLFPFIILPSVPLAMTGGIGGLAALNLYVFQALDMLTILGYRHPHRHRGQKRHPFGRPDPLLLAFRGAGPGRGHPGGDAHLNPAYLYVDPDQRIRTPAPSPVPGRRFRVLPGSGVRGGAGPVAVSRVDHDHHPAAAGPVSGMRPQEACSRRL